MNIAILHNNLNKFGGGEKVSINIMDELSKQGHKVMVYTLKKPQINNLNAFYGLKLDDTINFIHYNLKMFYRSFYADYLLARKLSKVEGFDVIIDTSSNGFYPINNPNSKAMCYVHFPMFQKPDSILLKLYSSPIYQKMGYDYDKYDTVIANSNFTREYVEHKYLSDHHSPVNVIYPPVTLLNRRDDYKQLLNAKEDIILVVGRLAPDKKMLFLVEEFKKISRDYPSYQMHIVGPATQHHPQYLTKLKDAAVGYPIHFHSEISRNELDDLYKKSRIYWHARGYEESNPIFFEHFGITTAEAINNGCIPIVINKGGQKEIVDDGINGFLWDNAEELQQHTLDVINGKINLEKFIKNALIKSEKFDQRIFREKMYKKIQSLQ